MNQTILKLLIKQLTQFKSQQIERTLEMLLDGDTVPFIARYRKEKTGNLDEVEIHLIEETYQTLENLEKRKESVLKAVDEQGKLTEELKNDILRAEKLQVVEDLYRPYKQKRRTKATIAKEKGLAPLAAQIWLMDKNNNIKEYAKQFIDLEKEVKTVQEALDGAHEILAEEISDNAKIRRFIREFMEKNGFIVSKVKEKELDEKGVFEMYYEYTEKIQTIQNHRILALNRGEKEGVLTVSFEIETQKIFARLEKEFLTQPQAPSAIYIENAYKDAYKRFIAPSIEREIRAELTARADESAIAVFGENLKNLLLQAPLKDKIVLGFDPAYRTGAKLAIIDETGKLLTTKVIYPVKPASVSQIQQAEKDFIQLVEKYKVEMVAIGNGTASRESEQFVAEALKKVNVDVYYTIVNEAGASVYSASEIARMEFPDLTVEKRSAISIGRRLQDPLAELVKIDPKAIGVGQYQHDVSQKRLNEELDFVVETAVNKVGVDVNTASGPLLQHIAGLNKTIANNVVAYREENGAFTTRPQLKKVARLGPKAYEQAVGFLRIPKAKNILDTTSIHPESYAVTESLLKELNISVKKLHAEETKAILQSANINQLAQKLSIGVPTLKDIIDALLAPGRDVRDSMPAPILRSDVLSMEDLEVGMELKGTVRNVVDFGAFVDIGVKQDGLVHLSKLSNKFIKHPNEVVALGDVVTVWIEHVDEKKGRISLTMRKTK